MIFIKPTARWHNFCFLIKIFILSKAAGLRFNKFSLFSLQLRLQKEAPVCLYLISMEMF